MRTLALNFVRATWWGSLAGAAPFLALFTIPLALSGGAPDLPTGLLLAGFSLIIAAVIVICSAMLFGLPLTAILSHNRRERQRDYTLAGLAAGTAVPALIILAVDGFRIEPMLFFTVPGMIAGTVTGLVWGRWRATLTTEAVSADG